MCFNGNYASYAIDPDDWDKYVIVKPEAKGTCEKRHLEQSDVAGIDSSLVEDDESITTDNRLSIGAK